MFSYNMYEYLKILKNKNNFNPINILDIGANVGEFSTTCKQHIWNSSNYYLIEGNDNCKDKLLSTGFNILINLLSDEDNKDVIFYMTKDDIYCTGNSIYREKTKHYNDDRVIKEIKQTTKLDTLFNNKNLTFDLAKLDTQGSELDILKGGVKTFSSCKYIIIEVSLKYYNDNIPLKNEIISYMNNIGFINYEIIEKHIWNIKESLNDINFGDVFQEDLIFYK